jgi:hypothetical protein
MKYTERDSFLFGLTLTELTFVIFMIFLLFFMNHLHEKQLEIDKQAEQNEKLIVEINAQKEKVKFYEDKLPEIKQDPDAFYSKLAEHPILLNRVAKLESENADLRKKNEMCSAIAKAISDHNLEAAPDQQINSEDLPEMISSAKGLQSIASGLGVDPQNLSSDELAKIISNKFKGYGDQLKVIKESCDAGFGPPPCWLVEENGKRKAEYIYVVVINETTMNIKQNWPDYREAEVKTIPGAYDILQDNLSISEFRKFARPIFNWSRKQNPECRHYVKIVDQAETKESFKERLKTIEGYFLRPYDI